MNIGNVVFAVVVAVVGLGVLKMVAASLSAMPVWLVVGFVAWLVYLTVNKGKPDA